VLNQVEESLYVEITHDFNIKDLIDEFDSFDFEIDAAVDGLAGFVCEKSLQKLK
jgi:hypothetical protein